MRVPHLLRHNSRSETPHAAVWFDTETMQRLESDTKVSHHLKFGYAAFARTRRTGEWTRPQWCRFESTAAFWDFVEGCLRPKVTLYLFCHNTNFDLPVLDLFGELPRRGWKLRTCVIDAPPTILKWRRESNQLIFLDTLNLWRMPLAGVGKMIGLRKLSMPAEGASPARWNAYARRDVKVIMRACIRWWEFLKGEDMGGFAPTLAGQSMRTFRHRYMKHDILIDANVQALEVARAAYVGGRTEAFFIGRVRRKVTVVDVNSMYPAVMAQSSYPTVLRGVYKRVGEAELLRLLAEGRVCADVTLNTDEPAYPARHRGKLVFPVGRFTAHLSSPELAHAITMGHLVACHRAAVYHAAPIFAEFVTDMYARRLAAARAGDKVSAWLFKILMNSLYGKFGQRGVVYERREDTPDLTARKWVEIDADTGKVYRWRQLGGIVQTQVDEAEGRESHPAIAAHVTAEARMLLWRLICEAGRENVLYCDTDSLWLTEDGRKRLTAHFDETRLGYLKVESQERTAVIWGPKDYRIGDKERHKGVKGDAWWTGRRTVVQEKWSSLRGLIASGQLTQPTTEVVGKRLARVYDKGVVGEGGAVSPLVFGPGSGSGA